MILSRTSPLAIVWYQHAPILQSHPAIDVTDTIISCPGMFQNTPGVVLNTIRCATLRRVPRDRPDRVGWLPRCVRTDGRVEVCAKMVPRLVEPRTFVQWVFKEQDSHQAFSQWRRHRSDGESGLPSTALDHVRATERSPMSLPRPWVSVGTIHGQNAPGWHPATGGVERAIRQSPTHYWDFSSNRHELALGADAGYLVLS